jgi:hypothetical protein
MPRIPHSRDIEKMAAKELANMLYQDEILKRKRSVDAEKKKTVQQALENLNTYGWVECPYPEYKDAGLMQTDPSKGETRVIKGSMFWIGECPNGKKVYVNIFVKRSAEADGSIIWMPDVVYMNEEDFQHWLNGEVGENDKTDKHTSQ